MRMPRPNHAMELALNRLLGSADPRVAAAQHVGAVVTSQLRIRKVRDPIATAEEAVRVLDRTDLVGRPRLPRDIRARYGALDPDEGYTDGHGGDMPACCHRMAEGKVRMIDRLQLPHEWQCDACRRVWVVESTFDLGVVS
jgi:hypothetical protein